MAHFRVQLLATGGTLAKRYDPQTGTLVVDNTVVDGMIARMTLPGLAIRVRHLVARDSLDMTAADRTQVVDAVQGHRDDSDAIIITHGTDTLSTTAQRLHDNLPGPDMPVVLTGAMVPYCCRDSDAFQNLAQAIMACRLLTRGIHVVFHGRVFDGAQVVKDYDAQTFVSALD